MLSAFPPNVNILGSRSGRCRRGTARTASLLGNDRLGQAVDWGKALIDAASLG
jgi:hypothetical protein